MREGRNSVRTERYRSISYANGDEELYDHQNDPNEWKNLADKTEYETIKKTLSKQLTDLLK